MTCFEDYFKAELKKLSKSKSFLDAAAHYIHNELKKRYENDDKFKLWDPNNPQGLCLHSKIECKGDYCMEFIFPYAFEGFKDLIHFQVDHM